MRISFLAGSLEPGRDGVGDYTRLLARELARCGVPCQAIAWSDPHVSAVTEETSDGVSLVRLPSSLRASDRLGRVEGAVQRFEPHCLSVQFVPYSFERHGVPVAFARALPRLVGRARPHVMVHETWIGSSGRWRSRVVAAAQRWALRRICRLPGAVVHTTNAFYRRRLAAEGVHASELPLFGSVPVTAHDGDRWLLPALAAAGATGIDRARGEWWVFVIFGTLHPVWPPEPLLPMLIAAAREAGRRVALVSVGRLGPGVAVWDDVVRRYAGAVTLLRLGEQPVERISELFNSADFGIATTPLEVLGKSATVAALLEHGLPVIVNREASPEAAGTAPADVWPAGVLRLDAALSRGLIESRRAARASRLPAVATQMLADLEA